MLFTLIEKDSNRIEKIFGMYYYTSNIIIFTCKHYISTAIEKVLRLGKMNCMFCTAILKLRTRKFVT